LGLGALAVSGYVGERERRIKAETVAETQAAIQKGLTNQIANLQKQMAERDSQYQSNLKTLDAKFSSAQSPQAVALLVSQLMGLKQPIQVVTPLPTVENPHPIPIAQVSTLDAPAVRDYLQT